MKSKISSISQLLLLCVTLGLVGCSNRSTLSTPIINRNLGSSAPTAKNDPTPTARTTPLAAMLTSTATLAFTSTPLPPARPIMPTATSTPLQTPTSTRPAATVQQQAHCRYGPGTAFLHSHDLYPGDRGVIDGRNHDASWLWLQPDGLERHCWAAASVLAWQGDINDLPVVTSKLPYSDLYGPPQNVQTARDGSQVTIAWDPLPFTEDDFRGYMLELTLCQGGELTTTTIQTNDTIISVNDDTNCGGESKGRLWGVEKHGYTQSVEIPWP